MHRKNHQPRKRFGQNFLHDKSIICKIIEAIHPKENEHFVEIGPGLGALTTNILPLIHRLDAIELDRDLIPKLKEACEDLGILTVYSEDALKFDYKKIQTDERPLRLIGNLPYNISTPLLFHLLKFNSIIQDMHFMLQKEVVERITAEPHTHDYGRLTIMIQYFCQAQALFEVSRECFKPRPKVTSKIIRLIPHKKIPFQANDFSQFEMIVRLAFNQRRKTIRNSLKSVFTTDKIASVGIDPQCRAETLSIQKFVQLSNSLSK